jgi:hypothetical protein
MPPLLDGPFEAVELLRDPYVLLVPAEHELASLGRASLADVGAHGRHPVYAKNQQLPLPQTPLTVVTRPSDGRRHLPLAAE